MPASVIAVLHSKGGTGKTTLSTQLARALQIERPGSRVLLIDTDVDQRSALDWRSRQDDEDAVGEMPDITVVVSGSLRRDVAGPRRLL